MVGVDLTDYSQIVIEHSLDQAARHQLPELHFLHVSDNRKRSPDELGERLSNVVYPSLQVFNQYGDGWRARLHVRHGKPDEHIPALAADVIADLIVVGQFGIRRRNTAKRVLAHAPCATLVVGMPPALDISQCQECASIREDSAGNRWFCDDHVGESPSVSPMTTWTGGQGTYSA